MFLNIFDCFDYLQVSQSIFKYLQILQSISKYLQISFNFGMVHPYGRMDDPSARMEGWMGPASIRMDGWVDGRPSHMDGCIFHPYGWMDGWMDGWVIHPYGLTTHPSIRMDDPSIPPYSWTIHSSPNLDGSSIHPYIIFSNIFKYLTYGSISSNMLKYCQISLNVCQCLWMFQISSHILKYVKSRTDSKIFQNVFKYFKTSSKYL